MQLVRLQYCVPVERNDKVSEFETSRKEAASREPTTHDERTLGIRPSVDLMERSEGKELGDERVV